MPKTATSIQLTEEQIQHLVSIIQKGTFPDSKDLKSLSVACYACVF